MRLEQLLSRIPDGINLFILGWRSLIHFFLSHRLSLILPVLADYLGIEVSAMKSFKIGELENCVEHIIMI